ncbi:MAG TPA: hypothetical protein VFJ12_04660 [Segeticoccus sp.]|nr:hypothetical protein [Segeticoccus sp.]
MCRWCSWWLAGSRLEVGAHHLGDVVASPLFALGTILVLLAIAGPARTVVHLMLPHDVVQRPRSGG